MLIIFALVSALGWLVSAVLFEAGYKVIKANGNVNIQKPKACRIWWLVLSTVSLASGLGGFLLGLPSLVAIGLSHIALAETSDGLITVADILRNVPEGLRQGIRRLRPFLR